ncbi:MAG TPA: SAM-dependent methyltransferase [Pirellulales bacterium]|nr:SAM-dependent methyltransferase [Pirellulales bacterium]
MSLHIFTCEPGWESVLSDELGRIFPDAARRQLAPGWVESRWRQEPALSEPCVAFASQCLPCSERLAAPSVSQWARKAGGWLLETLRDHDGPWRLHVFCVPLPGGPVRPARARLIEQAVLELLRKKQRRLLRSRVVEPAPPWDDDEALVQIGLMNAEEGFGSAALPPLRRRLRRCVSRFPGGQVQVAADSAAPSRAFAKLAEVQIRLARSIAPGERCVDLGSSPGSWAYLALRQGAQVTAIDRSPLRGDLMQHAKLNFVRGDAFRYQPPPAVDWLLCDVIAFPARTIELLERWIERRWCRWFCTTVKFKGQDDYARLEELKTWLEGASVDFFVRRLTSNKNEAMAFGRLREAGEAAWEAGQ